MSALDRRRILAAGAALAAPGIFGARTAQAIEAARRLGGNYARVFRRHLG